MGIRTSEIAEIPIPEPELTPQEIVARAQALVPMLREQQDEAERIGHHSEAVDREFVKAGFYRILQPRVFGGYEFDLPTFWKAMLAISTGDPGTGWGLTLGAHHALVVGAHFPEDGQREIFGATGEFRCPHRPVPSGTARPVDGGYVVSGFWDYCSGAPHSTHFMGNALIVDETGDPSENGELPIAFVTTRDRVTVLDDWGGGRILGMNSSGSNSVRVEDVFVPAHCTTPFNWSKWTEPPIGTTIHDNPMYLGRIGAVYHVGLVVPLIGAVRAALEEYEQIITTKDTLLPPVLPRYQSPDFQGPYGLGRALADAAEALVIRVGEQYMEFCERWRATGEPFSREDDLRLYSVVQQAGQLAVRAMQVVFRGAGSSSAKQGQRIQRYYRDVSMYHGHVAAQYENTARELAKVHFGLPDDLIF